MQHGLKDHEIAGLVNAVTEKMLPLTGLQSTRGLIAAVVVDYLEEEGLRIDAQNNKAGTV